MKKFVKFEFSIYAMRRHRTSSDSPKMRKSCVFSAVSSVQGYLLTSFSHNVRCPSSPLLQFIFSNFSLIDVTSSQPTLSLSYHVQ